MFACACVENGDVLTFNFNFSCVTDECSAEGTITSDASLQWSLRYVGHCIFQYSKFKGHKKSLAVLYVLFFLDCTANPLVGVLRHVTRQVKVEIMSTILHGMRSRAAATMRHVTTESVGQNALQLYDFLGGRFATKMYPAFSQYRRRVLRNLIP